MKRPPGAAASAAWTDDVAAAAGIAATRPNARARRKAVSRRGLMVTDGDSSSRSAKDGMDRRHVDAGWATALRTVRAADGTRNDPHWTTLHRRTGFGGGRSPSFSARGRVLARMPTFGPLTSGTSAATVSDQILGAKAATPFRAGDRCRPGADRALTPPAGPTDARTRWPARGRARSRARSGSPARPRSDRSDPVAGRCTGPIR